MTTKKFTPRKVTLATTTKAVTLAFMEAGKLSFAGGTFAKSARAKHDAIVNTLADVVKLDKPEAVRLINNTLDAMTKAGMKGEPRRQVVTSLKRALAVIHDNAIKVVIKERPERSVALEAVKPPENWVQAHKQTLKKLSAIMAEHSLTYYDVIAGVEVATESKASITVGVVGSDKAALLAAAKQDELKSVDSYEKGVMLELLAANG